MKRIFASGGTISVRDVPEPELRPGEVLIETLHSAVSVGTELWLLEGSADPTFVNHEYPVDPPTWPKTRTPIRRHHPLPRSGEPGFFSLGYSMAGRVLAVHEDVIDLAPGDLVAASGSQCAHHAEIVAVPRNLVARIPEGLPTHEAALVTVGAISVTALRATNCTFGETVVVYGMGLLGQLAAQIGAAAGFRVIGIDIDDRQLDLAKRLGVPHTINSRETDVADAVRDLTDGYGADGVVLGVKTESSEPLNLSFDMCRQRGTVVAQGLFGWEIDRSRFYSNQVQLVPSIGYGLGRYDPVYEEGNSDFPIGLGRWTGNRNQEYFLGLQQAGAIDTPALAGTHIPLDQAPDAYTLLRSAERPPTVVFSYPAAG